MREGDVVVLPLKTQRPKVALGYITGPYQYRQVEGSWETSEQVGNDGDPLLESCLVKAWSWAIQQLIQRFLGTTRAPSIGFAGK